MRNIIITMIFLLTLVGANGIVALTAKADDNPCIACQNRCGDHPHRFDFSSERTFGLAGFCILRILTRRNGEAADLRILIADWN